MMLPSLLCAALAAITLDGVTGERLTARAALDANNVRVGDPMTLTIDFIGSAEFRDLHPPALAREVDAKVWRVDDASAKTETDDFSKRLVYRVRPLREGLWEFPALAFAYDGGRTATRPIPVHVKAGVQAALAGLDADPEGLPMPDGLLLEVRSRELTDDLRFAWQKACRAPSAAAFAAFDFPEARLNEAACLTLDGNWARALKVYGALEWRTGQTPAIERGLVAALARRTADPAQELPAWRLAFRPVLRHAWPGRVGLVAGALALAAAAFWLCGRLIRLFAAAAFVLLLARPVAAQGMFDEIERMHQQMMQQMNSMMNLGGGMSMTINGQSVEQMEPVDIRATVAVSTNDVRVGETFRFLLSLEAPRAATLDQIRFTPSEMFGMVVMGKVETLADGASANPSNRVRRLAVPVRYDVPFTGDMSFRVEGMVSRRQQTGRSSFSFSRSFAVDSPAIPVEIKPLPTDGQPADFSGIIGTGFRLTVEADRTRVETNDVVRLSCALEYASGYVPPGAVEDVVSRRPGRLAWQRYFVADGSAAVPAASLSCYDTASRSYRRIASRAVPLTYTAGDGAAEAEAVAVDAGDGTGVRTLVLRFAPSEDAAVVERVKLTDGAPPPRETERRGDWVRLDTGRHAGWTRRAPDVR